MNSIRTEHAVVVRDLGVQFGRNTALRDVQLAVPTGSVFALIGPNGAGKTTLMKTLVNMHRPSQGEATVLGMPSTAVQGQALSRVGYVSENQELPGWMTLESFLGYLRPFYPTWDRALEDALLRQFRLPAGRKLRQMSRGQQMKAALLSALAYRPRLLILDEPFSGLDPLARDEFIEGLLDRVAASEAEEPLTVLLSSHDLAEIESFSTHVAFLNEGSVVFAEEIASLLARFREVAVVLETPFPPGSKLPATPSSWLLPVVSGTAVQFVHAQAEREPVEEQIAAVLPHVRGIELQPMPLRSIFLALARTEALRESARPLAPQAPTTSLSSPSVAVARSRP